MKPFGNCPASESRLCFELDGEHIIAVCARCRHAGQDWNADDRRRRRGLGQAVVDAAQERRRRQGEGLRDRGEGERFQQVETAQCQVAVQRHQVHRYIPSFCRL